MAIKRKDSENNRIVVDKLRQDVNNKLLYYLKKVPRYNELNFLITDANKKNEDVTLLLDELNTMKSLFNINKSKALILKQKENDVEELDVMKKSFEYRSLIMQKTHIKKNISKHTPHWYVKQIDIFRNSVQTSNSLHKNEISSFDTDFNIVDVQLENYKTLCLEISNILNIDVAEIYSLKSSNIKSKLTEHFSKENKVKILKENLIEIEAKLTKYINNFLKKPDIANIIFSAFGNIHEEKTEKILKEIMFSANILNVYSISQTVCMRTKNTHMTNDAVGFGLEGLTKAINKWYETQLIVNHALSFDAFMFKYITYDVSNGLRDLNHSGTIKSSNWNTVRIKNQDEINAFLEKNPQYSDLDHSVIFEMLKPHSKVLKRVDMVNNESTISEKIQSSTGGNDYDTSVDIFSGQSNIDELNSHDLLETSNEYNKMLQSLEDIFNTGKFEIYDYNSFDEPLYEETKEKMFTEYDKELFLMDIGFKYHHKTNKPYTLKEMSDVLIFLYKRNGVTTNRVGEEMTFGTSTISIRLKKIRDNIKIVIQHKPSLLNGFKYFVSIKDGENFRLHNIEKLTYMSNNRENKNNNFKL